MGTVNGMKALGYAIKGMTTEINSGPVAGKEVRGRFIWNVLEG